MTTRARALYMLLLANVFWGISFPLIKAIELANERLVPGANGAFITLYTIAPRFFLGVAAMALWMRRDILDITRSEWRHGAIIAVFGAGGMYFQNDGLRFTHASTSAFLTQLYAILIPVWLALRYRRSPPRIIWISCVLVLAGVAVLGGMDYHDFSLGRGEIETLVCSVFFGAQILWVEKSGHSGDRPVKLTVAISVVIGLLSGMASAIAAPSWRALVVPWTSPGWIALVVPIALISTVGAFLLMMMYQPKITASEAGIVYCTEPVFAAGFALFLPAILSGWAVVDYPNEHFTVSLVVGGVLITVANLLVQFRQTSPSG